jgi:hypothetical protein
MAQDSIIVFPTHPPPQKKSTTEPSGATPNQKFNNFGNVNFTTTIPLQEAHKSIIVKNE